MAHSCLIAMKRWMYRYRYLFCSHALYLLFMDLSPVLQLLTLYQHALFFIAALKHSLIRREKKRENEKVKNQPQSSQLKNFKEGEKIWTHGCHWLQHWTILSVVSNHR